MAKPKQVSDSTKQPPATFDGVPAGLTLRSVEKWVRPRVSEKRFRHIQGVADCAQQLAQASKESSYLAELAAWLHDACKETKGPELIHQAELRGIDLHPLERKYPHLLHGPVAALVARDELGLVNQMVLDAISQHTLGAAPMTRLAQIVFLADCLEPGRPADYTKPIWEALDLSGSVDLDLATVVACNLNLAHLLNSAKPIHPKTVDVRNYYLELVQSRKQPN